MKSRSEKITDIYLFVILAALPLFTGFSGYGEILESKWRLFATATVLWLAALLFSKPRLRPGKGKSLWALFALCLWALISALFSPFGFSACVLGAGFYDGFLPLFFYVAAAFFVAEAGKLSPWHVRVFAASLTLCLLVAHLQLAGGNPLQLFPNGWRFADAGIAYSGMYVSTVGNSLILCSVLSLALPWLALSAVRQRGFDWFLLIPVLMGLYVLYRCDGSSAWAALLIAAALALPLSVKKAVRRWLIPAEAAVIFLAVILVYFHPGNSVTLNELSGVLHGELSETFGSNRIRIWQAAWDLFRARPVPGGGPGTIALRMNIDFSRYVPETGEVLSSYVTNAHNEFLGYLVNLGIPGLALYLFAGVSLLCRRKCWQRDVLPLTLGWLGYAVQSFFGLGTPVSAPFFWIVWGLLLNKTQTGEDSLS